MITWQEWCYIIGGYLSGSILYSYLLPKALKGIDITAESPDGNPGTANAFTCAGIPIGILVLCMELLKGYLPVHLALREVNPLGLVPFWLPVLSLAALYLIFSLVIVIDPHFYRSVCTFVLFSVSIFCRVSMTGISVGCCLISAVVIRNHYARYRGEQMSVRLALHR